MEFGIFSSVKVVFLSWIWYNVLFGFHGDRPSTAKDIKLSSTIRHPSPLQETTRTRLDIPKGDLLGCESSTAVGVTKGRGTCRFRNLCTSSHLNLFFVNHGPRVRWRDPTRRVLSAINMRHDVTHISTVEGRLDYLTYAEVAEEYIDIGHHEYVIHSRGKHVLLRHVVPDNIAHDLHDVILPFFHTVGLPEIKNGPRYKDVKLRIQSGLGYSSELYRLFFEDFLTDDTRSLVQSGKGIICFEDVLVGLSRDSLWYQYGTTNIPQGPILDTNVTSDHLRNFTNFVRRKFEVDMSCPMNGYGVLFVRSRDRKILNRRELIKAVELNYGLNMVELDLDKNTLRDVIEMISCAKLAAGMHGSMMILGMFLSRDSVLLEMFPYAINPDHFTQYRSMVSIPGMDIEYIAWRNMNRTSSILATDEHLNVLLESISGLDGVSRERILNRWEVPPKLCCNNPEVRYRIYHDTIVDIPEVMNLLQNTSLEWNLL